MNVPGEGVGLQWSEHATQAQGAEAVDRLGLRNARRDRASEVLSSPTGGGGCFNSEVCGHLNDYAWRCMSMRRGLGWVGEQSRPVYAGRLREL